jgi:tetrahydromethanopterin S-methyltransferase subunit H
MLKFSSEQKVYQIGNVEIGGQQGERPTVLIGSIFFSGHSIVHNIEKGLFDKEKAEALLIREEELSIAYGNPRIIDVIGDTTEALIRYIEFVATHTSSPILIDSPLQKVRMEAVKYFTRTEIMPRLIYNAIAEDYTDEELACLKEYGVRSAVILAFSTKALKPKAKVKLLEDGLLPAAESAGIENIIIDTGVLDLPGVSWAAAAISEIKEHMGYPAGCAPANAIYTWEKMKAKGTPAFQSAASSVLSFTKAYGADFVFYGSMQNAPWVYPSMATVDALAAYGGRLNGLRTTTLEHPLYKIFK